MSFITSAVVLSAAAAATCAVAASLTIFAMHVQHRERLMRTAPRAIGTSQRRFAPLERHARGRY